LPQARAASACRPRPPRPRRMPETLRDEHGVRPSSLWPPTGLIQLQNHIAMSPWPMRTAHRRPLARGAAVQEPRHQYYRVSRLQNVPARVRSVCPTARSDAQRQRRERENAVYNMLRSAPRVTQARCR
jgi:hypothetical protein